MSIAYIQLFLNNLDIVLFDVGGPFGSREVTLVPGDPAKAVEVKLNNSRAVRVMASRKEAEVEDMASILVQFDEGGAPTFQQEQQSDIRLEGSKAKPYQAFVAEIRPVAI